MSISRKILTDNRNYKLTVFGENLFYLAYLDEAEISMDVLMEIVDGGKELLQGKPFYSVVNMQNVYGGLTDDAKHYMATDEEMARLKIFEIHYTNSLPMKILAQGYQMVHRPKTETKIVSNLKTLVDLLIKKGAEKEAVLELREYLKELKSTDRK